MLTAQITAVVIFLAMFTFIIIDKIERQWVSLACGAIMIIVVMGLMMRDPEAILETLALKQFTQSSFWISGSESAEGGAGINWMTIVFIAGMMIMVEGMARSGFFRWLCLMIARAVHYKPTRIFITFMAMSAVLSMFIDSITVILFLAAITIEIAEVLQFDPVPYIISEIFCANLGGSATMSGDPPNIIIGTALHYTFIDFVINIGPLALVAFVFAVVYFLIVFRKPLRDANTIVSDMTFTPPDPKTAITEMKSFIFSVIVFAAAIILLITHAKTGLTVAAIGTGIGLVTLLGNAKHAKELLKGVDYKTLLFFIGLFIVVGGLEETGILELIAGLISKWSKGNIMLAVAIIIWISAFASAFVDNIPFAATMVPIIQSLAATQGFALPTLAWTLSMGTDIGGSATPIGASANVVGIAVSNRHGYMISWGKYCKYSAPASIITVFLFMVMVFVRYC